MNEVWRVGETVRRRAGPWTGTVHQLLVYVRERGTNWAPEPLGMDVRGREVLSFVEGHVPAGGRGLALPCRTPAEVICHNDFSPHNLVFDGRALVGDIAYLATRLVPLGKSAGHEATAAEAVRWVDLMLEAYGSSASFHQVLVCAIDRLRDIADFSDRSAVELGSPELARHAESYREDARYLAGVLGG